MKQDQWKIASVRTMLFVISLLFVVATTTPPLYAEEFSDVYSNFVVDTVMGLNPPLPTKTDYQVARKTTTSGSNIKKGASMFLYPSNFDFRNTTVNPNERQSTDTDTSSEEFYSVSPPTSWIFLMAGPEDPYNGDIYGDIYSVAPESLFDTLYAQQATFMDSIAEDLKGDTSVYLPSSNTTITAITTPQTITSTLSSPNELTQNNQG